MTPQTQARNSPNGRDAGPAILKFEEVSLRFGDTVALDRVSFEMHAGETRVVFGAAGSGKTMMLKVAVGLQQPDSGKVLLFGQDITKMRERDQFELRARVGILFQEGGLFDSMTIRENVAYPLLNRSSHPIEGNGNGEGPVEDRVRQALRFVELEQTLDKVPSELSGGMRRRVGIARAVVTEPELLLYDSPTAGLDPITANTIIALLMKEREQRNTATIMVTHRYQDGQLMANFRYNSDSGSEQGRMVPVRDGDPGKTSTTFMVMNQGRLVFEGPEQELEASQDPYVRKFLRPGGA